MSPIRTPRYTAKRNFLWSWHVLNDLGKPVFIGTRHRCETHAQLLNIVFDLGFEMGKVAGLKQVKEELGL